MRTPEFTSQFKRDYKREKKGRHKKTLDSELNTVISALLADQSLEPRHRDHALYNNWAGSRDCHIKPDLVLIYQKPDDTRLVLLRLGSHSELKL